MPLVYGEFPRSPPLLHREGTPPYAEARVFPPL